MYSMKGDRHYEYQFAGGFIERVSGKHMLDIGPGSRASLAHHAKSLGWNVEAVDLVPGSWRNTTIGDFRTVALGRYTYDLILCVSSIEHFGIAGRYDVKKYEEDADLEGMARIYKLSARDTRVVLTIPVGVDSVLSPFHRVYGKHRLPLLLKGFSVIQEKFYLKRDGVDDYVEGTRDEALAEVPLLEPKHYAALGCFLLERHHA